MAFEVHPLGHADPLEVAGSATSGTQTLTELVAVGPSGNPEMYIFINGVEEGLGAPITLEPTYTLRFGTSGSAALNLSTAPTAEINDGFLGHVCQLTLSRPPTSPNLWQIRIIFANGETASAWSFNITNNEPTARKFVWVVADSETDAAQPWIHVDPDTIDFDTNGLALSGEETAESISVKNFGTGSLTIPAQALADVAFAIGTLPATLAPNQVANLPLTFTAPAGAGLHVVNQDLLSNDPIAMGAATTHNQRVDARATSAQVETILVLDASGSMKLKPDGSAAPNADDWRWSRLREGAEHFLDLLADHAPNGGRFGIAIFPDVDSADADNKSVPTSRQLFPPLPINGGNVADAKAELAITPRGWTPIGKGLLEAVGAGAGFGMFLGTAAALSFNRRTVVLMTDGAHNSPPPPGSPKPADFYQAGPLTNDVLHTKRIGVIGVAYGVEGSPEVDRAAIQTLVTESGAPPEAFVDAVAPLAPGDPDPFFKAFRKVLLANLELHSPSDPQGTLTDAVPEARHPVLITRFDKRVSFVVNWQGGANDIAVTLVSPNCDVITRDSASEKAGVTFRGGAHYAIFTVESSYLRNDSDPLLPRYGTWRIIVTRRSSVDRQGRAPVVYEYEVVTKSGIKMRSSLEGLVHAPGEPLTVRARLSADGVPIRNASVSVKLRVPEASLDNFLARATITQEEFAKAKDELKGGFDVRSQSIKVLALRNKGITFRPSERTDQYFLKETAPGHYEAVIPGYSTPGHRTLLVVASGDTADGVSFRRERELSAQIVVRPEVKFSDVLVDYVKGENRVQAVLQLFARDAFGNAVVFDPELEERVVFVARGAEKSGPVIDRLDGSYAQTFQLGRSTTVDVQVGGDAVIKGFVVPNPEGLHYVDQVVAFAPGREAKRGGNAHSKPEAVLGSLLDKPSEQFVSLGGLGGLTVGFKDPPSGAHAVTVFVHPDSPPRSYIVEASRDSGQRSIRLEAERAIRLKGALKRGRSALEHVGGPGIAVYEEVSFGAKPTELLFVASGQMRTANRVIRVVLDTGEVIAELRTRKGDKAPIELSTRTKPVSGRHAVAVEFDPQKSRFGEEATGAGIFDWFEFRPSWISLGSSKGFTATFPLPPELEKRAPSLRIVDTSDRTLDEKGAPSDTPGVSIRAVGIELG